MTSAVDYKALEKKTFRSLLRGLALDVFSTGYNAFYNMDALLSAKRIQFLYIHHVFADEEKAFTRLLEHLAKSNTFISYSEAVDRTLNGRIDKPYICISSDDGIKNNLRAAEILNRFGISACFFICPSIIGETDLKKTSEFSVKNMRFVPVEFLTWAEVETLQKQGHEIGGHTMTHVDVATTASNELNYEIGECYRQLAARCGPSLHFAYPFGKFSNFSEEGRKQVFEAGFISCASAERGCHIGNDQKKLQPQELLFRRDHIVLNWPLKHIDYFMARNVRIAAQQNNSYPY